jgi:large subunit ribosomal protein L10
MKTTGFSRVSKDIIISELEKEFKSRPAFFVAQHGTISATSLDQLRAKLRATNTRYFVVKNSLGKKALEKANLSQFSDSLSGSCGIAFSSGDIVASSKVLVDFAKDNVTFKVQNAYFNGEVVGADKVKILASLPSREVLLSRMVGGMQSPIRGFVQVLAGTIRQVVTVFDAIAKKKAGQ